MNLDALLTGTEAARWVGIRPQTFYGWVSAGRVSSVAVRGGSRLYRLRDVLEAERATLARRTAARKALDTLRAASCT